MYRDLGPDSKSSLSTENDDCLRVLVIGRDAQAMAAVFDRHSRSVYAVALSILRDPTSAEDVVQDVFLKFWRKPDGFVQGRGSLGGWLAASSRNRSIDVLRRRRSNESIEGVDIPSRGDLALEVERSRTMATVRTLLESLPPKQKQTIQMAFLDELTHSQICQMTGDAMGTIKTRSRAALSTLRCGLRKHGGTSQEPYASTDRDDALAPIDDRV